MAELISPLRCSNDSFSFVKTTIPCNPPVIFTGHLGSDAASSGFTKCAMTASSKNEIRLSDSQAEHLKECLYGKGIDGRREALEVELGVGDLFNRWKFAVMKSTCGIECWLLPLDPTKFYLGLPIDVMAGETLQSYGARSRAYGVIPAAGEDGKVPTGLLSKGAIVRIEDGLLSVLSLQWLAGKVDIMAEEMERHWTAPEATSSTMTYMEEVKNHWTVVGMLEDIANETSKPDCEICNVYWPIHNTELALSVSSFGSLRACCCITDQGDLYLVRINPDAAADAERSIVVEKAERNYRLFSEFYDRHYQGTLHISDDGRYCSGESQCQLMQSDNKTSRLLIVKRSAAHRRAEPSEHHHGRSDSNGMATRQNHIRIPSAFNFLGEITLPASKRSVALLVIDGVFPFNRKSYKSESLSTFILYDTSTEEFAVIGKFPHVHNRQCHTVTFAKDDMTILFVDNESVSSVERHDCWVASHQALEQLPTIAASEVLSPLAAFVSVCENKQEFDDAFSVQWMGTRCENGLRRVLFRRLGELNKYWLVAGVGEVPQILRAPGGIYKTLNSYDELSNYAGAVMWYGREGEKCFVREFAFVDWYMSASNSGIIDSYNLADSPTYVSLTRKASKHVVCGTVDHGDKKHIGGEGDVRWVGVVDIAAGDRRSEVAYRKISSCDDLMMGSVNTIEVVDGKLEVLNCSDVEPTRSTIDALNGTWKFQLPSSWDNDDRFPCLLARHVSCGHEVGDHSLQTFCKGISGLTNIQANDDEETFAAALYDFVKHKGSEYVNTCVENVMSQLAGAMSCKELSEIVGQHVDLGSGWFGVDVAMVNGSANNLMVGNYDNFISFDKEQEFVVFTDATDKCNMTGLTVKRLEGPLFTSAAAIFPSMACHSITLYRKGKNGVADRLCTLRPHIK